MHDEQLAVLIAGASALLTLTRGAAAEIDRRWGLSAAVVPHPHVVDLEVAQTIQARRSAEPRAEFRVGVHAKSLRAGMDPAVLIPALAEAVQEIPSGVLQVDVHPDVALPTGARHSPELMEALRSLDDAVDVRVHDYFSHDELVDYLASLDVSVLPYRFGTHSGWLEACRDVGTTVVAPACGYYADQGPVLSFRLDEDDFDPESLRQAVRSAWSAPPAADVRHRLQQRREIAALHRRVYEQVLATSPAAA